MKTIEAIELRNKKIQMQWLQDEKEAPAMQGMAINKLRQEYKGAKKYGYMLLGGREGLLDEGCYYLLQLKVNNEDGNKAGNALVAFKENGIDITGHAIFKNSDKYFAMLEADSILTEERWRRVAGVQ